MNKYFVLRSLTKDGRYIFFINPRGYGVMRFLADIEKRKEVTEEKTMIKHPLQKEIERCLEESSTLLIEAMKSGDASSQNIANKYYDAVRRIDTICENRKRY